MAAHHLGDLNSSLCMRGRRGEEGGRECKREEGAGREEGRGGREGGGRRNREGVERKMERKGGGKRGRWRYQITVCCILNMIQTFVWWE